MTTVIRPTSEQRDHYLTFVGLAEVAPDDRFAPPADAAPVAQRFAAQYRRFLVLVAATQVAEASRLAHRLPLVASEPTLPALRRCAAMLRAGMDWTEVAGTGLARREDVRDLAWFLLIAEGEPIAA